MPLKKSSSRAAFVSNLRTELKAGKAKDQALAIAYAVKRRSRAEGGEVSFDDRFTGEPYRETADDIAARARNLVRSQPQRMERVVPDVTQELGGPLIGDGGQFSPGTAWGNKAADIGSRLVKGMGEGIVHDLSVPGAGMKPNPYPEGSEEWHWYNDQLQQAATQWGPSMALNTVGTGLPFAQPGAAGIFGGRLAQTADHAALARAEKMHAEGAAPQQIHAETGWFQGADGKWRFEINDKNADFPAGYPTDRNIAASVGAFEHPELYKAYPDLAKSDLNVLPLEGFNGSYRAPSPATPGDLIPPPREAINLNQTPDRLQARSTMLHELQHAVQQREGFSPGSNPDAWRYVAQPVEDARKLIELGSPYEFTKAVGRQPHPAARELVARLTPEELAKVETDPYELYRRVAGEVEARNVQNRRDLSGAFRRLKYPRAGEDIPAEKQLIGASHDPAAPTADAAPAQPGAAADPAAVGSGGGGPGGNASLSEAQAAAARWAGERKPLEGLPGPLKIGDEHFVPGPIGKIHDVAEDYMRTHHPDRPYTPPTRYHPLDPEHSKAIAQAYEEMQHTPNDPATRASYDALIKETADQYQAIKKTGLKIEPILPGMEDPYAANPRLAAKDVAENNHLWFFPTESGFGTVNKISDNPMLRNTGEKIGDHPLLANDMFRIVHDYFGHLKEGHGFRAAGEDNAWRTHSAMYSDIARPAMTTETRGQNSWVNYGPHGEKNRTANAADTTYADQKVGLLPEWVMRDRGSPAPVMVYHGTPHSFDRFDISKIGAGEGNQAYGHGLYFAGHEPVSEWYRHQLATRQDPLLQNYKLQDVGHVIGSHLSDFGGDAAKLAAKYADERNKLIASGDTSKATSNMIDEYARRIDYLNNPQRATGHMYQVGMNVNPEHLLDYDAMFANQSPYVQGRTGPVMEQSIKEQLAAIDRLLEKGGTGTPGTRSFRPYTSFKKQDLEGRRLMLEQAGPNAFKGSEIYQRTGLPAKDPNEAAVNASQRLRAMDIPGLRYKDAGSRAPGQQGSHNYVMFGDDMLKILRKYGVVGIPAAGVLGADGEERRARGGKVDRAMRLARRRAEGGAAFGVLSPAEEAELPEGVPAKVIRGAAMNFATLPKRAYESSQRMVETGEYDPAPILEAATLPMGTGAMAGARALPREMIAGSGPVRRLVDDTGSAMTKPSRIYAEPEYAPSGSMIINKGVENPPNRKIQTVADPYRMMFPGVYRNPRIIAEEAAARVGEEDPAMQRLFGVTRGDLREMAQGRIGNEEPVVPPSGARSRGSLSAQNIQTPQNTQRLQDILAEAGRHEGLRTADAWYIMDPVYRRMVELFGPEEAAARYRRLNTLTGMASPGSDVMTEIQRGTGAHWLNEQGRFGDFQKYAGVPEAMRSSQRFPSDMRYIGGHPYHRTSQGDPMAKYLEHGSIQSDAPKVPLYVHASGVPETGFQTSGPVGDAHFSRGVGLSDTRKGPTDVQGSFSKPEYQTLQPWWQHEVAGEVGLESVPAQARLWTALGPQTGVESELGAPKLELLAKQIMTAAKRLRVSPETARDMVLSGKAGAGVLAGGMLAPSAIEAMREPRADGGKVSSALALARSVKRARGGKVHTGAIIGDTDGRADEVPMEVPDGAYVLTADHVSSMGEGNTLGGFKKLDQMFPKSAASHRAQKIVKRAAGGAVPIYAADGEYVICPEDITDRWGDLEAGHRYLDAWQTSSRKEHVNTLRNLAPPAQD
jgi:hypothetical protein